MPSGLNSSENPPWYRRLVISCVVIICIFTLIFSYYKLIRRLLSRLHRTRLSRSQNRRSALNELNPDDPSLRFQRKGLDFSITQSLPVTQFKKKDEAEAAEEHGQSNTDCAVCLGEFEDGEWLKHLPKCTHAFHSSCIDAWFVSHSNCPLCRSEVHDFMHVCIVPMDTTIETPSDIQERAWELHFQFLRSAILERSPLGREARNVQ